MDTLKKFTGKRSSSDSTAEAAGSSSSRVRDSRCASIASTVAEQPESGIRPVGRDEPRAPPCSRAQCAAIAPRRSSPPDRPGLASALLPTAPCVCLQAPTTASHVRATAEVQQQFKELTLSPAQREGKEPVFEGRVTGDCPQLWPSCRD